ncbi:MAG: DinB family protein [Chloroflexota bacterium]|nr:DinB family protein [Chloroflexota bacterium]
MQQIFLGSSPKNDRFLTEAVNTFARVATRLADAVLEQENWRWRAYEGVRMAFLQTYLELRELATIIAMDRAQHGPALTTAQRILGQHHIAYQSLRGVLVGVNSAEADRSPAEGEWPLRRVLPHIMDTERGFAAVMHYALERYRRGEPPAEMSDETAMNVYHLTDDDFYQAPYEQMLTLYEEMHNRVLAELAGMPEDELSAPSLWWEEEEVTMRFRLHRFDAHLREHTIQVEKTLVGIGHPPSEIERQLRLIYEALGEAEGALIGAWQSNSERQRQLAETITARAHELEVV